MQTRSPPFWLMIVSIAMAVLPVWRSPMISSRWPRPIGISASTALMPVSTGEATDLRVTTPGAIRSTQRVHHAPEQRGPDGNLHDPAGRLDDVAFLDRGRVAQDDGADRLLGQVEGHAHDAAGKFQELGRQRALQAIDRGDAVTDLDDRPDVARLRGRIEVVDVGFDDADDLVGSDGHSVLRSGAGSASFSDEAVAEARKPSPHAGIDESVADADGQTPDQLGVDRRLDLDARAGHSRDALGDGREIGGFEGFGAGDVRNDDAVLPIDESLELVGDAGQDREPAAPGEEEDEVPGRRADARSQEARDDRSAVVPGDGRVVDDRGRLLHADELHGEAELVSVEEAA